MDKRKKKIFIVVSIILVLLLIVGIFFIFNSEDEEVPTTEVKVGDMGIIDWNNKENVKIKGDNKYNVSKEVADDHVYDEYKFTDMKIYTKDYKCYFKFKITNIADSKIDDNYMVFINFLDKEGNIIFIMNYLIPDLKIGESKVESFDIPVDTTNAYDYEVVAF